MNTQPTHPPRKTPTAPDVRPNALITGAAHRIGRSIALELSAAGYGVAVHYRHNKDKAEDLVKHIANSGGQAVALQVDLTDEAQVKTLVPKAEKALGPLTALINNASEFEHDSVETCTRESWDMHMDVNLRAPFVLSQMFAAQMPKDTHGAIINILDQRVWNLTPFFMSYTISKSALWTLTQTLAMALAPHIRVNGVGPGPTIKNVRQTEDDFVRQWSEIPLQRRIEPQEIADAVRYILNAPSLTGQMIALDGGQHLGWAQASNLKPQFE